MTDDKIITTFETLITWHDMNAGSIPEHQKLLILIKKVHYHLFETDGTIYVNNKPVFCTSTGSIVPYEDLIRFAKFPEFK